MSLKNDITNFHIKIYIKKKVEFALILVTKIFMFIDIY